MNRTPDATLQRPVDVAIIGSGFSGLCMAIRLKQEGCSDFVVLEKGSEVGGTWRDNTYPGCACDVQSHLYSYSFEPNPYWSRMFAPQPEIHAYLRHCADKYGLRPHLRFGKKLVEARFDEDGRAWVLKIEDGSVVVARAVVSGMGALHVPSYPRIRGMTRFKGVSFHSAQWQHDYAFEGKRVAVIGSGASAIQFVPQLQKRVQQLTLFQRTPSWILPKPDRPMRQAERWLFRELPWTQQLLRARIYWQLESRVLGFAVHPKLMKLVEWIARRHIRKQITDPELREKVTPRYTIGCKRILISNDYYPALNSSNVEVVTTGIREITARAVLTTDGRRHEVDAIVYATGFQAQELVPRGTILGRNGRDLVDAWPQGPEAYLGLNVAGFPNFFFLLGPNTGLGHNSMIFMVESQVEYVLDALRQMRAQQWQTVDVREDVQQAFNRRIQKELSSAVWASGCQSWYLNESGKNTILWPGFTWKYRAKTRRFHTEAYRAEPAPTLSVKV